MTHVINPDGLAALRERVDANIGHLRAARYDGDGGSTSAPEGSPVELAVTQPDRRSEKACNDLADLERAMRIVRRVEADYPPGRHPDQRRLPGLGVCPDDRCPTHWAAGVSIKRARDRRQCHACSAFTQRTGHDYPPLVLQVHREIVAAMTADGMRRERAEAQAWDHQRIHRAWHATGWQSHPGDRYPTRLSA